MHANINGPKTHCWYWICVYKQYLKTYLDLTKYNTMMALIIAFPVKGGFQIDWLLVYSRTLYISLNSLVETELHKGDPAWEASTIPLHIRHVYLDKSSQMLVITNWQNVLTMGATHGKCSALSCLPCRSSGCVICGAAATITFIGTTVLVRCPRLQKTVRMAFRSSLFCRKQTGPRRIVSRNSKFWRSLVRTILSISFFIFGKVCVTAIRGIKKIASKRQAVRMPTLTLKMFCPLPKFLFFTLIYTAIIVCDSNIQSRAAIKINIDIWANNFSVKSSNNKLGSAIHEASNGLFVRTKGMAVAIAHNPEMHERITMWRMFRLTTEPLKQTYRRNVDIAARW